jgi:hypothetical protein
MKIMQEEKIYGWIFIFFILILFPCSQVCADGGFVSRESVAVSVDQRAILIKNGNAVSMTFSTGYTGEGEDFGWIIPTPVPPAIEDVDEAGESGENAFEILDEYSAPKIVTSHGCFPSGTAVITACGHRSIETIDPGAEVVTYDPASGKWNLARVLNRQSFLYEGDIVDIYVGDGQIQATGNHPFYVLRGERLASRPLPRDIPKEDLRMIELGRWVEARDLKVGDALKNMGGEGLIITDLSTRYETTEVYNLDVEGFHTYAIHQKGILVHNKGGRGTEVAAGHEPFVTVYGTVTLEHYEVSVLAAADASVLLKWLQDNGYQVNPGSQEVLDAYIDRSWAFVAVKLNPSEKRHYENEFLPPLTVQYQYDELIFPLRISSISTTQAVRITLYVIAESTVSSLNFPTRTLKYNRHLLARGDPKSYVEECLQETLGSEDHALVVMWRGEFDRTKAIDELIKVPFPNGKKFYLTRLETGMDPADVTEDIRLEFDRWQRKFRVHSKGSEASEKFRFFSILALAFFIVIGLPIGGCLVGLFFLIRMIVRRIRQRRNRRD